MMFETFYQTVVPFINSPFNCVTAVCHYVNVKKGFKCIGMNEEMFTMGTIPSTIQASELMPENWNRSDKEVSLLYQGPKNHGNLLLKVVNAQEMALVHLMRNTNDEVRDLSIPYKEHIGTDYAKYNNAYVNLEGLLDLLETRLLNPLMPSAAKQPASSPSPTASQSSPRNFSPHHPSRPQPSFHPPHHPSFPCGRNDLDPLGHCTHPSGGMMFDPLGLYAPRHRQPPNINPAHFPPGSVPPGARFDPTDPFSNPSGTFGPDPDDMPRPGFNDPFNF